MGRKNRRRQVARLFSEQTQLLKSYRPFVDDVAERAEVHEQAGRLGVSRHVLFSVAVAGQCTLPFNLRGAQNLGRLIDDEKAGFEIVEKACLKIVVAWKDGSHPRRCVQVDDSKRGDMFVIFVGGPLVCRLELDIGNGLGRPLGLRIEGAYLLEIVTDELEPYGCGTARREDVQDATAAGEIARRRDGVLVTKAEREEVALELARVEAVARREPPNAAHEELGPDRTVQERGCGRHHDDLLVLREGHERADAR